MQAPFFTRLGQVRRRQHQQRVWRCSAAGLLFGSLVGIVLGLGRWVADWSVASWALAAIPVLGMIVGIAVGLTRRSSWHAAAAAIDRHYRLQDRTVTALEFCMLPWRTVLHTLQIVEATDRLQRMEARQVVKLRAPRVLPYGIVATALALALALWPSNQPRAAAKAPQPLPGLIKEAQLIEEDLAELEELALEEGDEKILKLIKELRRKALELKQPGAELHKTLATLSEMQSVLAATQAEMNVQLVDEHLQSLGKAMSGAGATQSVGKALERADYEKAAKELEKLDDPKMDRQEAKVLEEKLKQVAEAMKKAKLKQLGKSVSEMAEGAREKKSRFKKGARSLARQTRKHERRRRLQELMAIQKQRMGDCKSRCKTSWLSWMRQRNKQNKQNQQKQQSQQAQQNQSSGEKRGGGNNDPLGEKTKRNVRSQSEDLKGTLGQGSSDVEEVLAATGEGALSSQQGRERPVRSGKPRRSSEAILGEEAFPLGHRQTIRKYFELIRPESESPR